MTPKEIFRWFSDQATVTDAGCWETHLSEQNDYGYTQISIEGKNWKLHRFAFSISHGDISESEQIHHKCANPKCFNPEHLEAISKRDNIAEMLERRYYRDRIAELEAEVIALKEQLKEAKNAFCDC
ncbi:HNH endonuclease signature motif containing protein [Streptomyces ardesiacus]|uniref:HNH endonuclease signature motif containing protein n=1 Tax=Streptomyces ardesiacus TaxID=285564 RepID=UPI0036625145